jgi:hypothetical protein
MTDTQGMASERVSQSHPSACGHTLQLSNSTANRNFQNDITPLPLPYIHTHTHARACGAID